MGNRVFRARRNIIEERYTRPQRLLRQPSNIDYKKLRKLILSHKLAPCFDGLEDSNSNSDLEECPICFFFYPSLNRSRCCSKGICTECFLQMNPSNAIRPAQCPFCKSSSYAVEYRGAKTEEEKGLEQAEEQKVIEAKIRMQFQESQTTDQVPSVNQQARPVEVHYPIQGSIQQTNGWIQDGGNSNLSLHGRGIEVSQSPFPNALNERHAEFGLNLDEVMLMEAIWQSIQANCPQDCSSQQLSESYGMAGSHIGTYGSNQGFPYLAMIGQEEIQSSNSITGGAASVIARLAERNILQSGAFHSTNNNMQASPNQNAHFVEQQNCLLSTLPHNANMLQMGLGSAADSEFNEAMAENECLASCSTTEDGSWDSLSAPVPEGSHGSEDEFLSDEDLVKEEEIDDASSCSSVHTISDISGGSPDCSDMYESQYSSQIAAVRHQREFSEYQS
ncbi:hypothetical protein AQUCO_01600385v1 [Aquilegia coerulea]|uniref:RING-type domain-containing protein n=2 Tax=Aquilegia coerulea TaxID=218851 RepID=A0A2G5DRB6_AQUCA|nr:hypothetical protein AQUCO_01600385v1 [Aquilegia coerulea]